ncbi:hypothetical protein [Vibrio sp. 1180_3]|uniref:hypothetical protein n=1 Tax=Vibrio sp. 1180_3 TaxID=2528832 RepID=UPI002406B135|nr:hypothetical protein [Vibrio sp. 1180_3]MDF9399110.1 hypothetical protein [Vibrio sp. 1180_3]
MKDMKENLHELESAEILLAKVIHSSMDIEKVLTEIHSSNAGLVLEDMHETRIFIKKCQHYIGGEHAS